MSEGSSKANSNKEYNATATHQSSTTTTTTSSSSSTPSKGGGRGSGGRGGSRGGRGRGRGGGRGKSGGRGGGNNDNEDGGSGNSRNKGRGGRGGGSSRKNNSGNNEQQGESTTTAENTDKNKAKGGRGGRGGGRGGRGGGRGRGNKSGGGRGGRGRHSNRNNRRENSKSPVRSVGYSEDDEEYETSTQHQRHHESLIIEEKSSTEVSAALESIIQQQQQQQNNFGAVSASAAPTTTTPPSLLFAPKPPTPPPPLPPTSSSAAPGGGTSGMLSLPRPPTGGARAPGVPIILSRNSVIPAPVISHPDDNEDNDRELHIAEKLAAAALLDDDDDDFNSDQEEKKEVTFQEESVDIILQDHHHQQQQQNPPQEQEQSKMPSADDAGATATDSGSSAAAKKKTRRQKKKKTKAAAEEEEVEEAAAPPVVEEPEPEVSTTDALKALPAQEVSISASTPKILMKKKDETSSSNTSLSNLIDSPMNSNNTTTKKEKGDKGKKKKGKGKKKGLSNDDAANKKAARTFNRSVRACVERSDPDGMKEILHNKKNHNFALDKNVLETVMKAYVMAAMFDDALYCLRNCALPGTLSCQQTERILTCLPQNLRNSSAYTAADMINALCIATEFDKPTSRTYYLRIVRGIALEFLEEATSARDRICSAPCERLVRSALCVVDARFKRGKKNKGTELIVQPGHQLGVFVPDTLENRGIQAGDAVSILPYAGPYPMSAESLDRNMIEATVTSAQPTLILRLQDKTNSALHAMLTENVDGNVYRIDKLANRMGFNRQLSAAVSIASPVSTDDKNGSKVFDRRRPSPELIKAISAMDENIDRVMKLSGGNINNPRLNDGELTSTAALCAQAVPWNAQDEYGYNYDNDNDYDDGRPPPSTDNSGGLDQDAIRGESALALDKYGALEGLNASQSLSVEGAVTNRLTLIQGPPGTGKTAVAIRILQHWARLSGGSADYNSRERKEPSPVLATSDSNIAVDNLVEGCASVGLRVVRLGRPEAIRPELLRYCIDRPTSTSGGRGGGPGGGPGGNTYGSSASTAFKEKMKILKNAQIICCTCIGSGGDILDNMTFERVLVDEATQATEPAVLVPLTRGCRQLVLVGDHCQLPPTVLSTRAEEEGLGVPLFSRMVACGVPPFMLDTQYRMHPAIAMFPSDLFYGGKLRNGVSPPERRPLAGFPWPREEFPVAFVPVNHGIELDDGVSKLNEAEAAAACDAVAALLDGGQCTVSDIAVVTPYAAQARLIRRMTRQLTQNRGPPYVEVSSTDGFQGREKEAVVFSAVRSNDYGAVGFVQDWRRVNVSFTRARRALIVIGNDQTLRRGDPDTWMPWLAWADAHGVNMDKPGVPRGRYEPEQLRRVRGGTTAAEMLKDVLARQQAQLKTAEKQLEKAERNAEGHIIGTDDNDDSNNNDGSGGGIVNGEIGGIGGIGGVGGSTSMMKVNSLEEDLAALANEDGCWDDSDDEDDNGNNNNNGGGKLLNHSVSQPSLTTVSSSNDIRIGGLDSAVTSDNDEPTDAWDL